MTKKFILLVIVLTVLLFTTSGCALQYCRKYVLHGVDYRFTFEYPADYRILGNGKLLYCARPALEGHWDNSWLWVKTTKKEKTGERENARKLLESDVSIYSTSEQYTDFEIIETNTFTVDGIEGDLRIFSYYNPNSPILGPPPGTTLKLPASMVARFAYFDYRGYIVELKISSTKEATEQANREFEHLLETFRIIE